MRNFLRALAGPAQIIQSLGAMVGEASQREAQLRASDLMQIEALRAEVAQLQAENAKLKAADPAKPDAPPKP